MSMDVPALCSECLLCIHVQNSFNINTQSTAIGTTELVLCGIPPGTTDELKEPCQITWHSLPDAAELLCVLCHKRRRR